MDSIVLVKGVPRTEGMKYDPNLGRMVREGSQLVLNPFDQRALRVALELRRPGESITAMSLGPAEVRPLLREARALGVDRAILLSDPGFAGSDTLVTARAIAHSVRGRPHDLVLGGSRSTDGETGQVPAEVAELLDLPLLADARSMRWARGGTELEVTVDTAVGWEAFRVPLPLVVTVGEKIGKPLRATPEAVAALPEPSVEIYDLAALGLSLAEVGQAGSPTSVSAVAPTGTRRVHRVFREGSVEDRVRQAVEVLGELLPASRPSFAEIPPALEDRPARGEVLVLVTGKNGNLATSSLGLVSEVRRALPTHWPSVVWVGEPPSDSATARVVTAGALSGYSILGTGDQVNARAVAGALESVYEERPEAAAIIALSDPFGREAMGRFAARQGLGLVGDATEMRTGPDRQILWSKPSFAGAATAEVRTTTRPTLATIPPGLFPPASESSRGERFCWRPVEARKVPSGFYRLGEGVEGPDPADLERRDVLVAVGMGVGGPEGIERLQPMLRRWDAGLVATRRVVDGGWVPRSVQLGLTGRSLAPRLAVLLGVSGSLNHMVGWQRAGAILAVNRDAEARVFAAVDVGIVADVWEALHMLTEEIATRLER